MCALSMTPFVSADAPLTSSIASFAARAVVTIAHRFIVQ
jgi:hypothetical protein